jgi:prolyl-tRNA synthetase
MNKAGGVEIFMPALTPMDLYERTNRREAFGRVLINFEIQRGGSKVHVALGPTHEEVVTDLMAKHISSYRQLPITLYQIQTKFRNEERPRFGVLRTSEFIMKDAYSFSTSLAQLDQAYQAMYDAYCRIFSRCGLDYLPVEAESGPIGGDASHEFMIPADNGEDKIVYCKNCKYGANLERAETGRKPPLISAPETAPPMQIVETPNVSSIDAVAKFLKKPPESFIKTLIFKADAQIVAVLIRGDHEANENKIRRVLNATSVEFASPKDIEEVTGAPVGFAGPVGIKCKIIADHDAVQVINSVVGANLADKHIINVNPVRDYAIETSYDLRNAAVNDPCPRCSGTLDFVHGIEVGHVFKLGTKYSVSLDAQFLDEKEERHPIIMGCYGIGVNRILAGLAETRHDDKGLIWPLPIAPYEVIVIPVNIKEEEASTVATKLYQDLQAAGIDVIFDDRDQRPGVKFNDADLIGIPLRIVIGGKGLKEGIVEVKWRRDAEPVKVPAQDVCSTIINMVKEERAKFVQK